jgi:uncharacterized protein
MLLVDTNVWADTADTSAPHHEACARLLRERGGDLVTVPTVIAEAAWFIEDRVGPHRWAMFLRLVTSPRVTIVDLTEQDWARTLQLVETYASMGLGTVDASIVAVAERLGITDIATMNGRDFHTVRPAHTTAFTLLPAGVERPTGKT